MWQAIQYVTSGATLLAFLAAVAAWVYRSRVDQRARLIKAAPESERPDLIMAALESLNVTTENLPEEKKYKLALALIRERSQRFRTTAIVACVFGILTAATTAYAIRQPEEVKPVLEAPVFPEPVSDSTGLRKDTLPHPVVSADTAIQRSFRINETNSDHKSFETNTKQYSKVFDADVGYTISSYEWKPTSATRESDLTFNLVGGGSQIRVDFKLKCGPKTDKYRGWLRGNLVTTQQRVRSD